MKNIVIIALSVLLGVSIISGAILYRRNMDAKDALRISEDKAVELNKKINLLNEEVSKFHEQIRDYSKRFKEMGILKKRISQLESEIKIKDQTEYRLKEKIRNVEKEVEKTRKMIGIFRTKLQAKDTQLGEFQEQHTKTGSQILSLEEEIIKYQSNREKRSKQYLKLQNEYGVLQGQLSNIEKQKVVAEGKIRQLISTHENNISDLKKMTLFGAKLTEGQLKSTEENILKIKAVESDIEKAVEGVKSVGFTEEEINARGQMTVWQRLSYLVDPGTWCPLHTLYNPEDNTEGTNNVIDGLGKISGKWAVIIGFDNKVFAGAWLPGQAENILRVTHLSKRLNIPLVWLVNCSGVKLTEQEKFYATRRGGGATFFRHAELEQLGIPILAGIYGTNPAGGGYHGISPTVLFAHKNCNIAVGGGGILSGMSPKGYFDIEGAESLIESAEQFKAEPPGSVKIHYDETGFFRYVFEEETGVLDGLKDYMKDMPAYHPKFFRVADPVEPRFPTEDLYRLIPFNQKQMYSFEEVLARLVDGSEHMEFRSDYGPEVYTGLCKIDGFLVGIIGNLQGYLGEDYPEYAPYPGIGGKLYRQGLIKLNEFVTHCGRDRVPIVWFQDTTGIDVGDLAEKAELLGLGQALIYSIQQTDVPQLLVLLRKGTAAAHYIMGGPTANRHNAFTLGIPTTEVYVMHGETAAAASFSRRLVKEKNANRPLEPIIEKMNQMAKTYHDNSRPIYCATTGFVDETIPMTHIRSYLKAFAGAVYQNPKSICPQHQMMLPRIIRG